MERIKLLIFDLDGVIYRGNTLLPGAKETIQELRNRGKYIAFLTNNSTQTRYQYKKKLSRLGIKTNISEIFTSAWGTARFLKNKGARKAFVIGEEGLKKELRWAGIEVTFLPQNDVDFVVVGLDRRFNYKKLCNAFEAVKKGAKFIATNMDYTFPLEDKIVPGGGAIVASLRWALNMEPVIIGKPSLFLLELIINHYGVNKEQSVIVGDRLDTDIEMGKRAGMKTVLVLTGITSREEVESYPIKPDEVIEKLDYLREIEWLK
jgi:HAD superfamily hydrolase (TIGR01457 family)